MIKIYLIIIAHENKDEFLDKLNSIIDINEYIGKLITKDGSKNRLLDENYEAIKQYNVPTKKSKIQNIISVKLSKSKSGRNTTKGIYTVFIYFIR